MGPIGSPETSVLNQSVRFRNFCFPWKALVQTLQTCALHAAIAQRNPLDVTQHTQHLLDDIIIIIIIIII